MTMDLPIIMHLWKAFVMKEKEAKYQTFIPEGREAEFIQMVRIVHRQLFMKCSPLFLVKSSRTITVLVDVHDIKVYWSKVPVC